MMTATKEKRDVSKAVKEEPKPVITFRKATVHDTGQMQELVRMFHDEHLDDMGFSMSDVMFKKIASTGILKTTWVAILPDEIIPAEYEDIVDGEGNIGQRMVSAEDIRHGKVVGIFSGYFTTYILNNDKIFHELVWYVSPEHRRCGMDLYRHCAQQIKLSGAEKMIMIHMATDKGEKLSGLYKSMGFKPLETHFIKDL